MRRLVLDTNIWLDWLVFEDTSIAHIRQLQGAGHVELCIDALCEAELAGVLARPFGKRQLDGAAQQAALSACRRVTTRIDIQAPQTNTPLTKTIGKVGQPVHIFSALRRRQPPR